MQKAIVIQSHKSNYPDPIHFDVGDQVVLGIEDENFPGWIKVITEDGNSGWAPIQYLDVRSKKVAVAIQSYNARELDTKIDDELEVLTLLNGWAFVKTSNGIKAWVPTSTLKILNSDQA